MAERKKLGEMLLEAKVINATQLQSALAHQRQWGSKIGTALMEKGFVDEETLVKFLSQQKGVLGIVLGKIKIAPDVLKRIPRELQEKHCLVPVVLEKMGNRETLTIAMADPSNLQALDEVRFAIGGVRTKTPIASEAMIRKAIAGDSRQFRPSLGGPPEPRPEVTDEFAVVRGTMEQTVITSGSTPVMPVAPAKAAKGPPARGVESAPVGEAVLELDVDPEFAEVEPVQLDAADFEPIVTNVGPAPTAAPSRGAAAPPASPPPAVSDPFLDALRGPPRQPNGSAPVRPAQASVPAAARPAPVVPAAAPSRAIPGVSPFLAPDEDHTERDIPMAAPTPAAPEPEPEPEPEPPVLGEAFPPETEAAPSWSSASPGADPWPEPPPEPSFEPLAETAPWPPVEEISGTSPEYAETLGGPPPEDAGGLTDLGPGAVPVLATGASPLENSLPEISLPGPEVPEGVSRVGAFDPDTAPETDLGASAGAGMFSIPSELEVQEGSIPGEVAPAEQWEPTAADEAIPEPEYVEPGFETSVSAAAPVEAPAEMPVETMAEAPSEGDLAPFPADPTMPEYEAAPPDLQPPEEIAPELMTSSTAGMVPSIGAPGSEDHAEATAIGSGHHEPTWDAPMEFTAPPEGSVLAEPEMGAAPGVDQLRPPEIEEDRNSVTRESPFPMGTEVARGAVMLSPLHVEEAPAEPPESVPEPEPEPEHEPTVFSSPETEPTAFGAPETLAPPREVTPPTRQSDVVPPSVRVPVEAVAPADREATPATPVALDASSTGAIAAAASAATSDEQAALNTLVSKKLRLLNAITEILLEKGLITEEEIREKIAKKK